MGSEAGFRRSEHGEKEEAKENDKKAKGAVWLFPAGSEFTRMPLNP